MTQEGRKLYDAANEYAWNIDSGDLNTNRDSFIAGAKWQYEQFEKERLNFEPRLKHCDELTAEQAQIESDFVVQHLKKNNRTPTFIDAIEYGRKQMIDKACEYIHNHWNKLLVYDYNQFGGSVFNRKKTVEQFRKAMEE